MRNPVKNLKVPIYGYLYKALTTEGNDWEAFFIPNYQYVLHPSNSNILYSEPRMVVDIASMLLYVLDAKSHSGVEDGEGRLWLQSVMTSFALYMSKYPIITPYTLDALIEDYINVGVALQIPYELLKENIDKFSTALLNAQTILWDRKQASIIYTIIFNKLSKLYPDIKVKFSDFDGYNCYKNVSVIATIKDNMRACYTFAEKEPAIYIK